MTNDPKKVLQALNDFWHDKKRSLSEVLQTDIEALNTYLMPIGDEFGFRQEIIGQDIYWYNKDGILELIFFYIPDPRDLNRVMGAFKKTRDNKIIYSWILTHQWTDGEGTWDVFGLFRRRGLIHWNRFWGNRELIVERGPSLRPEIDSLFECGKDFPAISRRRWATMMEKDLDKARTLLSELAEKFDCSSSCTEPFVIWQNNHKTEAMFTIRQEIPSFDEYLAIYEEIQNRRCPVTFLFQHVNQYVFDIFRLTARSYLCHHNQAKR
jgi:hypothetical protein